MTLSKRRKCGLQFLDFDRAAQVRVLVLDEPGWFAM
jgi:hypothetical protein